MSSTKIHQRLWLPCLALGPRVLLFIVLWLWDSINIYFHLLSRAVCRVKAMVMSILMEVHGQPRKRALFSDTCEAFGVECSKSTEDGTHTCVGLNPACCLLAVWLQAASWTSLSPTLLPVKGIIIPPAAQDGFEAWRRKYSCKVFIEYETIFISFILKPKGNETCFFVLKWGFKKMRENNVRTWRTSVSYSGVWIKDNWT